MAITKPQMLAARKRAQELKSHVPKVVSARFDATHRLLVIGFENGAFVSLPSSVLQGVDRAHAQDMRVIEVSPSGYGIHIPAIDADFHVPALLQGVFGTSAWMTERSRKGGQSSSAAKQAAAKANGKLGGRPRKKKEALEDAA